MKKRQAPPAIRIPVSVWITIKHLPRRTKEDWLKYINTCIELIGQATIPRDIFESLHFTFQEIGYEYLVGTLTISFRQKTINRAIEFGDALPSKQDQKELKKNVWKIP